MVAKGQLYLSHPMALILNIETSSTVCSVCLAKDGQDLAYRSDPNANSHARVLTIFIEELLDSSHIKLADLDAIAVSAGPGSYTGLRIGASVAKGLCYALSKPLIAVSTLQAMAGGMEAQVKMQNAFYMPVIDARRMDMYAALYAPDGKEIWAPFFATIDNQLQERLQAHGTDIWIGGSAATKCKNFFALPLTYFADGVDADARYLVKLAEEKFSKMEFEDTAYFVPFYLKEFGS